MHIKQFDTVDVWNIGIILHKYNQCRYLNMIFYGKTKQIHVFNIRKQQYINSYIVYMHLYLGVSETRDKLHKFMRIFTPKNKKIKQFNIVKSHIDILYF